MISKLLHLSARNINVYSGISPSLLATMSLSVNIRGKTHHQLIKNIKNANLIQDKNQISAFQMIDRQLFTKTINPYENKPYPISKGEKMTDIFTHAVIINNLTPYWKDNIKILDIGTGHGYLCFLIAQILQNNKYNNFQINGVDINEQAINFCNKINNELRPNDQRVIFKSDNLKQYLEKQKKTYDIIIGGYYFQQSLSDLLTGYLSQNGVGIWPTRSDFGQGLFKVQPNKQKCYIIETLFSMPVIRSQVSKYFIENSQQSENLSAEQQQQERQQSKELTLQRTNKMRTEIENKLKNQLKELLIKYRKPNGKLLNLQEMKQNSEIKAKLYQLQRLPKTKIKDKVK